MRRETFRSAGITSEMRLKWLIKIRKVSHINRGLEGEFVGAIYNFAVV